MIDVKWGLVDVKIAHVSSVISRLLVFTLVVSLTFGSSALGTTVQASTSDSYRYEFVVNENGFTNVVVNYESTARKGWSWVFVPKFSNWSETVLAGSILQSNFADTENVTGVDYYFYQVFNFSYTSVGSFRMKIEFNMSIGAFIIEPRGMFFSPQIGFKEGSNGEANVSLPSDYEIDRNKALAIGEWNYKPKSVDKNYAFFDLQENLVRLQIEFSTKLTTPDIETIRQGIFTFDAVKRYESYANETLNFYNAVYSDLVDLFNVTLENTNATFFIPDFDIFLSVGGYVPFTGEEMGDIHLNIFFERTVKGVLEVIALHELIHRFLWKTGLSPDDFLWFHEGMAQYVSIEVVNKLGYEGAATERERLEEASSQLIISRRGERFYFLQYWSPEDQPVNIGEYYAASYYVVSRLAEEYDGFDYYARFFKSIREKPIENVDILTYHLSLAANETVAPMLTKWGFDVADLYISSALIEEARKEIEDLNPMFQPYKFLAETFYKQGLISLEKENARMGNSYLRIAIFLAKWAPLLTLITWVTILIAIIYIFSRLTAPPKPEI